MSPNYKLRSKICYVVIVILLFVSGSFYSRMLTLEMDISKLINKIDTSTSDAPSNDSSSSYEDGVSDGKKEGYDEGYEHGYEAGFTDGAEAGYEDGYSEGSANKLDSLSNMEKYKFLYRNGFIDGLVHGIDPDTKPKGNIGSVKTFEDEYETIRYVDEYLKDYDISSDLFEFSQMYRFK